MAGNPKGNPENFANVPKCGRRVKNCKDCGHRYTKQEYELWNCPECGRDRHCLQPSIDGLEGNACKFHGGRSKGGIESATFSHGRHSKMARFVPQRFEEIFAAVGDDPLDLTEMTRAMVARFWDVVGKTQRGDSEELMEQALKYCDELDESQLRASQAQIRLQAATAANDLNAIDAAKAEIQEWSTKAGQAWQNIKNALKQNLADWRTWNNAIDIALKTTRVAESQRKRLVEEKLMMGMDQVQRIYFAMAESVNRHVTDPEKRRLIQGDFKSIALHGLGAPDVIEQPPDDTPEAELEV